MIAQKKHIAVAAIFLAVATVLAGCKEDSPQPTNNNNSDSTARLSDKEAGRGIYDISHVDQSRVITFDDLAIRTATGRELQITAHAYCKEAAAEIRDFDTYVEACREITGNKLMHGARHETIGSRFANYPAMDSETIRPWNRFTKPMMLRSVPRNFPGDRYTITDIRQCEDGQQVPPLTLNNPEPYPSTEERKASQTTEPRVGRVVGGQCHFD